MEQRAEADKVMRKPGDGWRARVTPAPSPAPGVRGGGSAGALREGLWDWQGAELDEVWGGLEGERWL